MNTEYIKRNGHSNKHLARAIEEGDRHFKNYAAYILEELPNTTLAMLRDYYKHNASAKEIRAHYERISNGGRA
jgi:hypothetical protein